MARKMPLILIQLMSLHFLISFLIINDFQILMDYILDTHISAFFTFGQEM